MTDYDVDSTDVFSDNWPFLESEPYVQPMRPAAVAAVFGLGFLLGSLIVWLINGVMFG